MSQLQIPESFLSYDLKEISTFDSFWLVNQSHKVDFTGEAEQGTITIYKKAEGSSEVSAKAIDWTKKGQLEAYLARKDLVLLEVRNSSLPFELPRDIFLQLLQHKIEELEYLLETQTIAFVRPLYIRRIQESNAYKAISYAETNDGRWVKLPPQPTSVQTIPGFIYVPDKHEALFWESEFAAEGEDSDPEAPGQDITMFYKPMFPTYAPDDWFVPGGVDPGDEEELEGPQEDRSRGFYLETANQTETQRLAQQYREHGMPNAPEHPENTQYAHDGKEFPPFVKVDPKVVSDKTAPRYAMTAYDIVRKIQAERIKPSEEDECPSCGTVGEYYTFHNKDHACTRCFSHFDFRGQKLPSYGLKGYDESIALGEIEPVDIGKLKRKPLDALNTEEDPEDGTQQAEEIFKQNSPSFASRRSGVTIHRVFGEEDDQDFDDGLEPEDDDEDLDEGESY